MPHVLHTTNWSMELVLAPFLLWKPWGWGFGGRCGWWGFTPLRHFYFPLVSPKPQERDCPKTVSMLKTCLPSTKVYIHLLCPIKVNQCLCLHSCFLWCTINIAFLCNLNHSCQISLTKNKISIYGEFIHVFFIISHNYRLKNMSDAFLKVDCTNK